MVLDRRHSAKGSEMLSTVTLADPVYTTPITRNISSTSITERSEEFSEQQSKTLEEGRAETNLTDSDLANTVPELQRWNHPKINAFRTLATFWNFMVLGANDAVYGALIPYIEIYYGIDYLTVSLIFLSPIVGYVSSALTNNAIHVKFGQRGIAVIVGVAHLVAFIVISLHPPYPVLVVIFMIAGYGNGLADAGFNAWIGDMANANEVLGFLHGMYGLGALLSPLIATTLITKAGWNWWEFYYIMIGVAAIEIVVLTSTFWHATGAVYQAQHASTQHELTPQNIEALASAVNEQDAAGTERKAPWVQRLNPFHAEFFMNQPLRRSKGQSDKPGKVRSTRFIKNMPSTTVEAVNNRVTILSAFFLLFYVGAEVSIGGWIVTFMLRVRGGTNFASGVVATGFWTGVTVGRFVLGFVTGRLFPTEKHAIACYLVLCFMLQLLFWLIPNFIVSAVMVALIGFFLAPCFPGAVVAMTKLLPKRLHVAGVGFAAATGAAGATILPFAVGAIAQGKGVVVLQPIILALFVVITFLWLLLPRLPKQRMA